MAKQRVATAVIELETDASTMKPGLEAGKKHVKGFSEEVSRSLEATEKDAKALSVALSNVFGTDLQRKAQASVEAIRQAGGAVRLTDTEARKHIATLDAWIAKANRLGKDVSDDILSTRAAIARTNTELDKGPSKLSSFTSSLKGFAGALGIAFSIGAVKTFVSGVFDAAGQIDDMSKKLGVSAEAMQRWKFAAEQGGASIETVDKAVGFMNRTLAEGDKSTIGALKQAGLSFTEIRRMKPEDAFNAIVEAVGKIKDPMTQARVAVQLLGRDALDLLPAIIEGFAKTGAAAHVMSDETVKRLADAGDAWKKFGGIVTIYTGEVIAESMAIVEGAIAAIDRMTSSWRKFAQTVEIIAAGSLTGFKGVTDALKAIKKIEDGEGAGPKETPAQAEERRKKAVAAAIAMAKAAADEAAASAKAKKAKEDLLEIDKKLAAARIPLTATQKTLIQQLIADGLSHSEVAKKLGVSEIAVRKFDDANKELSKTLDTLAKARIEPLKRGLNDYLRIITGIEQIPLMKRDTMTDLRFGKFNDVLGVDAATGRVKNPLDQLKGTDFMAWVKIVTGGQTQVQKKNQELKVSFSQLASEIAQLGQVTGGTFGGMLQDIATVVGAIDQARKSQDMFSAGLDKGFSFEGILGMASGIMGIATAAIAAGKALANLFGIGGTQGRDMMRNFFQSMGGEDELRRRLVAALGEQGHSLMRDLFRIGRNDSRQAEETIARVTKALEEGERKAASFNSSLNKMLTDIQSLGVGLPDSLRAYLSELERGTRLTQDNIDLIAQLGAEGTTDWRKIEEAVQRYGGDIAKLGGTFQAQRLHESWQQVIDDMDLFARGGIDAGEALDLTQGKIIELVNQSIKFGTEIPENMRPWIESLIRSGELVDENGEKITDISKLTFGETLQTSLQKLTDQIMRLIEELNKVPSAVGAIPRRVDVDVVYNRRGDPTLPDVPESGADSAARGGLVTAHGVQYLRRGGMLRSIFRPRGTDTVPAMLTPGEGVLNLRAMNMIGASGLRALNAGRVPGGSSAMAAATASPNLSVSVDASGAYFDTEQRVDQLAKKIVRSINHNKGGTRNELFGRGLALGTI